jgi:hypothetical protein
LREKAAAVNYFTDTDRDVWTVYRKKQALRMTSLSAVNYFDDMEQTVLKAVYVKTQVPLHH